MARRTTAGRLMVEAALPESLRSRADHLDKKRLAALLEDIAKEHPDKYREISHRLNQIGREVSYTTGGFSYGLDDLRTAKAAIAARERLRAEIAKLDDDDSLDDDQRERAMLSAIGKASEGLADAVYQESLDERNPLAWQVLSGARGSRQNLSSLRGADMLYVGHRDRPVPVPITRNYSEGLTPVQYWAAAYGARRGLIDVKLSTQRAGYLSKVMNAASHRAMVTALDDDEADPNEPPRGLVVDTDDPDNEGALLSVAAGGYPRDTPLTGKILSELKRKGVDRLLVRSPLTSGSPEGGVYARDVGIREFGRLPRVGEQVGLTAAQALSEPVTQMQLGSKHGGGVAGAVKGLSGFAAINQQVNPPKQIRGGAAHSELDGVVTAIDDAAAGGKIVRIGGEDHYVGVGHEPRVKVGDRVEAGDAISDGIPNPVAYVRHHGIGEGRRRFVEAMRRTYADAGVRANRRSLELLSRGLINHVRLTDDIGDYTVDDVVPYSTLARTWRPREDATSLAARAAVGMHLERPVLHYSVGTKVRPSMLPDLERFHPGPLLVHKDPPPFEPTMIRGVDTLRHDPDWLVRLYGGGQKDSLLRGVHRGAYSDPTGSSFVPGLAMGTGFGKTTGPVRSPLPSRDEKRAEWTPEQERQIQAMTFMRRSLRDARNVGQVGHDAYSDEQARMAANPASNAADLFDGTVNPLMDTAWNASEVMGRHLSLRAPVGDASERAQYHLPGADAWNEAISNQSQVSAKDLLDMATPIREANPEMWAEAGRRAHAQTQGSGVASPDPWIESLRSGTPAGQAAPTELMAGRELPNISHGYQPGGGLLQYLPMLNAMAPGLAGRLLHTAGPAGLAMLLDTNAMTTLTRGGAPRTKPPAPAAAPAPAASPRPQALPTPSAAPAAAPRPRALPAPATAPASTPKPRALPAPVKPPAPQRMPTHPNVPTPAGVTRPPGPTQPTSPVPGA